jgi:hypothetical protein
MTVKPKGAATRNTSSNDRSSTTRLTDSEIQETLFLDLPLPPKELHPNSRSHWRRHAAEKQSHRRDVGDMAAIQAIEKLGRRPQWSHVLIYSDFIVSAKHDRDNLIAWLKVTIDGVADAGIVTNDRHVWYAPPKQTIDRNDPRLFLWIGPVINGQVLEFKISFDE